MFHGAADFWVLKNLNLFKAKVESEPKIFFYLIWVLPETLH